MAEKSGFFTAKLDNGEWDRKYTAEQFANYFARFISNGVFMNKSSSSLMVVALPEEGMKIKICAGDAFIDGYWYENDSDLKKSIGLADGVLGRIDVVVARYDNEARETKIQIIEGVPSTNPVEPSLVRNADFYDLALARISIPAGATKIQSSYVTDLRLDSNYCGSVGALVEQIDTTSYGSQLNDFIANYIYQSDKRYESFVEMLEDIKASYNRLAKEFEESSEADFNTWFNSIKGKLNSDQAGNLQLQVEDLYGKVGDADSLGLASGYGVSIKDSKCNNIILKNLGMNLFKPTVGTQTVNGVEFVVNEDGTIIANGTASKAALFTLNNEALWLDAGEYNFSGCPKNGSVGTYDLQPIVGGSWMPWFDLGEGKSMTFDDKKSIKLVIQIAEGFVCNNLVFKPMINVGTEKRRFVEKKSLRVTVCSKNLWGKKIESTDKIILDEGEQSYPGYVISKPISVMNSGVAISLNSVTNVTENDKLRIGLYKSGEYVSRVIKDFVEGSVVKINKSDDYDEIKVSYNSATKFEMQIEYSENVTQYEKYRESYVDISSIDKLPVSIKSFGENVNVIAEDNAYVETVYAKLSKANPIIDYARRVDKAKLDEMSNKVSDHDFAIRRLKALGINNNMLINSDFVDPINQRNFDEVYDNSSESDSNVFFIDRWQINKNVGRTLLYRTGKSVKIIQNAGQKSYASFCQYVEHPKRYTGKSIGFSCKYRLKPTGSGINNEDIYAYIGCNCKTSSGERYHDNRRLLCDGEWHVFEDLFFLYELIDFFGDNNDLSSLSFSFFVGNCEETRNFERGYTTIYDLPYGVELEIEWAKAEVGNFTTPYIPRLYAEEMQLCRRYYKEVDISTAKLYSVSTLKNT